MSQSALTRAVRIVNILIAVALAVALSVLYWFVWRPLPQRSGSILAQVTAPASVSFDTLGEPHIHAANLEDALFVQ
jgi:penicillin amidase